MRRYKYEHELFARGKREDTKAWVEGYLIEQNSPEYHAYIIQSFKAEIDDRHIDILECDIYEVIPETVGWCTGLRDKNDNRIFEGDILSAEWLNKTITGIVTYSDLPASFALLKDDEYFWFEDDIYCNSYEVVGNIHDNPEFLK